MNEKQNMKNLQYFVTNKTNCRVLESFSGFNYFNSEQITLWKTNSAVTTEKL